MNTKMKFALAVFNAICSGLLMAFYISHHYFDGSFSSVLRLCGFFFICFCSMKFTYVIDGVETVRELSFYNFGRTILNVFLLILVM